ncbi:MAG: T9SS type A sorting domain-containing protein [Bacteroidetes bacterium]|nr:MAG: T9SS type A sorting domain-containing protein [Bacteroidota bacterium]
MKKIYLSIVALSVASATFAQSFLRQEMTGAVAKEVQFPAAGVAAADPTDTLGVDEFGGDFWIYTSNSGYVFGTSDLEGQVQGQTVHQLNYEYAGGFLVNGSYTVLGAMFFTGGKEAVSGSPANMKVKIWSLADDKAYLDGQSQSPTEIGPNQALATEDVAFDDIDTSMATFVTFSNPVWVNTDFALGLDIQALYNGANPADTVYFLCDEDGSSDGAYTWTKLGFDIVPGQFFWTLSTGLLQGGLNVNLALFAIVAESATGIEEQAYLNGVKMTTYPNPAMTSDNVTVQYGLERDVKNVEINIYDMGGKQVFNAALGAKASGVHTLNIPAGTLSAGSYIYSIEADGGRMAKRMEILK